MTTTTTTTTSEVATSLGWSLDQVPEQDRARVAALIPPAAFADQYVSRDLFGVPDFDVFATALVSKRNVMLSGPTGSAKTTAAKAFAAAAGLPFYAVPINGAIDPSTMFGSIRADRNGEHYHQKTDAALVAIYGGVFVVDEVNMAHPRSLAACYGLFDSRRSVTFEQDYGRTVACSASLLIVATMNPGYEGTARLNQALSNRFPWLFEWDYKREVEVQLVRSTSLLDLADNVRDLDEVRTATPTNALMEYCESFDLFGQAFAVGSFLARYPEHERSGVARALEMYQPAISAELSATSDSDSTSEVI